MKGLAARPIARLLLAAVVIAAVVAAFLRGHHLLGVGCGVGYAATSVALAGLAARSRTPTGRVSAARVVFLALFALPVGYAMAFPASLNPDVQVFIDKQATDRRAREELAAVFGPAPVYRDLSVSSAHLKVVNITVAGSVGTRADLERLRSRIVAECPALRMCFLHWDVSLRDTGGRVSGPDRDLFQGAQPGAAPDRGPPSRPRRVS
ncbi:MAG TPA: hypothetical protein VGE74_17005 [Gemmata sp.]